MEQNELELKADVENLPCDESMKEIVGVYVTEKAKSYNGEKFVMMTRDEAVAWLDSINASADQRATILQAFDTKIIFTEDHKVETWMKIPEGIPQEEIDAAIASGELGEVKDGRFCPEPPKEWKAVNGKYYYNTGEKREMFGEKVSPWDEVRLVDGLMEYGEGLLVLKKEE